MESYSCCLSLLLSSLSLKVAKAVGNEGGSAAAEVGRAADGMDVAAAAVIELEILAADLPRTSL